MGWPSSSERSYPKNFSTCVLISPIFPSRLVTTMASGENSNRLRNRSSLLRKASSACLRSVTSLLISRMAVGFPSGSHCKTRRLATTMRFPSFAV